MLSRLLISIVTSLAVVCVAPLPAAGQDVGAGPATSLEGMRDYPIRPVPPTRVHIDDDFWSRRIATNSEVTVPYCFKKCEETGRIDNFAIAGGLQEGKFEGIYFNDSDVFKVIEGAAYVLADHEDTELQAYVESVIALIAAAQEDDGYLYTARTLCGDDYMPPGGEQRWSNIVSGHELYNVGHLYEAAVAWHESTGDRKLLDVALKNADLVCSVFGPDGRHDPPGHEEIEIGLVKLYRATGERKYLDTAKFFLDRRGRIENRNRLFGPYCQDHLPVVDQTEAVGHSVRAGYLYCGMADVAALTGEADYVAAIDRLWKDVATTKLYVTGGIGARGGGEAFGQAYELPNRTAYCETCAAVANAMWNWRMFLLHGDGKYMDVVERVIYNGFLSGISMEGDSFFYPNPLESRGGRRSAWFGCSCCPANIVRFVPSVPGYAYAHTDDVLFVNLFAAGEADIAMLDQTIRLKQETRYPWDGDIQITVTPAEEAEMELRLRIPGWARHEAVPSDLYRFAETCDAPVRMEINGERVTFEPENGYACIRRNWKAGDVVRLLLPMPARRVMANEAVVADRGKVAIQRGPIVFCAEGVDQQEGQVFCLALPPSARLEAEDAPDLLGGVVVLRGTAKAVVRDSKGTARFGEDRPLTLIPYYAWAHRQPCEMAVWIATTPDAAQPLPGPTIAAKSRASASVDGALYALCDQLEPSSSGDHANERFHWWPRKGTTEWVQYDFEAPTRVSAVEVYWFDDTGRGECRLPVAWKLLAKVDGQWNEVTAPSEYGVEADQYNRTTFEPVIAEGLRIEVTSPEGFAGGIHEWKVQ